MKNMIRTVASSLVVAAVFATAPTASATILTTALNVDNFFDVYISTSDNQIGTYIGSGSNWGATISHQMVLNKGTDYYLHVAGYDVDGTAAMLGQVSLSGSDHEFANGQTFMTTNRAFWTGNNVGFNGVYTNLTFAGTNGAGPWGQQAGVNASAEWIWAGHTVNNNASYFTTKISANEVPEPGSLMLLGLGALVIGAVRRKAAAK
ncbi:MAG: PEP-CTERM sorting domain-containing protein [Telluria sp.]